MNEETIYKLNDAWAIHKEDLKEKKFYIFNVQNGDIIKLNEVSFDILNSIDGKRSVMDIVDIIQQMYNVEEKVLLNDIFNLLMKCIEKDIISEI